MPETPATAITFLDNLVGEQVSFRLAGQSGSTWGPYQLLAVYPDAPLPAILVEGSREYLVPLASIAVIHSGAKPTHSEHYARKHGSDPNTGELSVPGMPGIQIEDTDADGADD